MGTVSGAGVLTPAGTGTATITATSTQDTTKSGSASIVITSSTASEWTWMGGSITGVQSGVSGVYGTLGTAASTNTPGGRVSAMSWSDALGNLWLFGGMGADSTGEGGVLNDLWKFDPALGANGEWTWIGGSSTVGSNGGQSGVYGTLGIAASSNIPGGRVSAMSWIGSSGNLWLFGGHGYDSTGAVGYLNDLWKFDPALGTNGEWIWMGGSSTVGCNCSNGGQPGVYGTLGTAASTNIPGARDSAVSWSDASGKLWLFGGGGIDSAGADGVLNDLWKFDPALGTNGEWTWMGGSSRSTVSGDSGTNPGVYGSLGIPASGNIPGGREGAVSRVDSGGNLWLFGGTGVGANSLVGDLNDLWEFDPKLGTSGEWAWMGGSTVQSDGYISGVYGTLGTANSTNIPGARSSAVSWSDASGNLWLFGGFGVYSSTEVGDLNDLWEFDPKLGTNGEWTWMGGSSTIGSKGGQSGVYGTLGVAASTNIPGGRQNAVSWSDASGNLWLFGGDGKDSTGTSVRLNDLWKLHP
ncbi:MAG: hypothetical protein ABSE55_05440 [Terracidiphilus sp.]